MIVVKCESQSACVHWTVNMIDNSPKKQKFLIVGGIELLEIFGSLHKTRSLSFMELGKVFKGGDILVRPEDFHLLSEADLQGYSLIVLQGAELLHGLDRFNEAFIFNPPKGFTGERIKKKWLSADPTKEKVEVKKFKKSCVVTELEPVYTLV